MDEKNELWMQEMARRAEQSEAAAADFANTTATFHLRLLERGVGQAEAAHITGCYVASLVAGATGGKRNG
ncbi:MAG: hypothetical protein R6X32_06040 [Chloroflexota bacterium]